MTDRKSKSLNIRINKVYTRSGDSGKTRLVGGEDRYKDDGRVEAYGTVDELKYRKGKNPLKLDYDQRTLLLLVNEFFKFKENISK